MTLLETKRLTLRCINGEDAKFYLRLVNEPGWLTYIGDKKIYTLQQSRESIIAGPLAMQARLGFSLYICELADTAIPIGLCGLIKRDSLPDVDIGFAFLAEFCGNGYATEAAKAVVDYAFTTIGLTRLLAITTPDNRRSIQLLERLGLSFVEEVVLADSVKLVNLFECQRMPR